MRLIDLKNQAWASFRDIENSFQKLLSPIYDQYNISSLQLRVLSYIHTKKKCTIGEVGDYFGIAGGNISNLCKKLELDGYLTRTRSAQDRRIVFVSLSPKGKRTLNKIVDTLEDLYGESIHQLDESEVREVFKHMDQIVSFLDDLVRLR